MVTPITANAAEDNNYIDADGTSVAIPTDATAVTGSDTVWATGWYVVDGNIEITGDILVVGEVNLVLKEGCSLTITGTIDADSGNTLVIYGQSKGTGTMNVEVNGESEYVAVDVSELIINGGTVNVTTTCLGKSTTYGILCDRLSIKGGAVNVSATQSAANLGSATGIYGRESVEISGGTVYVSAKQPERDAYGIDSDDARIIGGTVTLDVAGRDSENTSLFYGALSVEDSGTLVLPSTMSKTEVMALGITGTGGIKFGNVHIDTAGNCITHRWTNKVIKKDTTNHYTRYCNVCMYRDEETLEPCVYDNVCDTDCNICKIVRTVPHQYDENGFCTVCRYSDSAAVDSDGDGFLEIDTAQKLWWFTYQVKWGQNELNAELTANIDLAGTCGEDIGNWLPIGNKYSGHFNGQGFTISNLYMTGDELYVGLFGHIYGATIENVSVTGNVSSTLLYDGDYNSAASGGIVAYMDDGTVRNCHVDMTVSGGSIIGGICGKLDSDGLIENCTTLGSAQGGEEVNYIGGIVGDLWSGTVRGCTNAATVGNILEIATYAGGIAGSSFGIIENCLNFGNVEIAGTYGGHGGITGNQGWDNIVRNCGNHGTVSGYCTGGIVGDNCGIIENCYNVGSVSGTSENVTPIAYSRDGGTATNNYYLSDTTTEDGGRTAEQFASGQVAYELNGSTTTDESVWKQTLGTDTYPTLTGDNVYYVASKKCDGTVIGQIYSNSSKDVVVHEDYIDQIAEKDATHHYTQVCSSCSKGNEETTAKHTFVDGVCTSCSYACTHSDADSDCLCDICTVALTHKDENSDYLCEVCGSLFDAKAFFDPDLWAYMLRNFDADNNNLLSQAEIASVTSVDIRGINVIKISGIEHFSNLTEIKCDIDMIWYTMSYDLSRSGIDISKVTVESGAVIGDLNGKTVLLIEDGESTVVGTYALFENSTPIALTMSILAPHTHTYEDVVWPDFVKTPATCSIGTIYYKSCECGRISDETFENVDRNPEKHTGIDNVYLSNDNGTHNIVWSCCNVVSVENDICEPLVSDKSCLTAEICECKYVIKAAATEHDFSGDYLHDADGHWHECKNCSVTDAKEEHSGIDDGSCLTAVICYCETVLIEGKDDHDFDNACDTDCNNDGCKHTRITYHEPLPDDGNCTTPIRCAICQEITTEAKEHSFDNTCDTTCNNKDCKYTRSITHTPNEDDGDCETAIHCKICDAITTPAKSHSYTNACDTTCDNDGCKHTRATEHTPEDDDGDCTTDILCSICDAVTTKGKESHVGGNATCTAKAKCEVCGTAYGSTLAHTPEADDGNCMTAVKCSVCQTVTTPANAAHTGGTATCTAQAVCEDCGTSYGSTLAHNYTVVQKDETYHWNKCENCEAIDEKIEHRYGNDHVCDDCAYDNTPDLPPANDGLSGGAIAGIVIGSVGVSGIGVFLVVWFVVKKKSWKDLFKK